MGVLGRPARAARRGFTLFELILTVSLILLLAGGLIFGWDSLQRGAQLDEGADQVEMLLRFARAHAATSGRQVRVRIGSPENLPGTPPGTNSTATPTPAADPGGIQVLWEPDPLKRPGSFEPLPGTESFRERIEEWVEIQAPEAAAPGNPSMEPVPWMREGQTNAQVTDLTGLSGSASPGRPQLQVTFYPDGSSDPADWVLVSRDPTDTRRLRIRLSGLTGTTRRQWLERPDLLGMTNGEPAAPYPEASSTADPIQKAGP